MNNLRVIAEYDNACADLARQLSALSETSSQLQSGLIGLQSLNNSNALQRQYYDSIASRYNSFIRANWSELKEVGAGIQLEEKPLFITVGNR
jgi:hypothetical protein